MRYMGTRPRPKNMARPDQRLSAVRVIIRMM
jgi:hypothetical protein